MKITTGNISPRFLISTDNSRLWKSENLILKAFIRTLKQPPCIITRDCKKIFTQISQGPTFNSTNPVYWQTITDDLKKMMAVIRSAGIGKSGLCQWPDTKSGVSVKNEVASRFE